jgi:hypothetical protein
MRFWAAAFLGVMLFQGAAYANDLSGAGEASFADLRFRCVATPIRNGFVSFAEEHWGLVRTKLAALHRCYRATHRACYITVCTRVSNRR